MRNANIYIIIPVATSLLMTLLYFSGESSLQQVIAPTIPSLLQESWREFGFLESLQNIYLVTIISLAVIGVTQKKMNYEKFILAMITLVAAFIFLEEIDYGLHYYEYFTGTEQVSAGQRNWHNQRYEGKSNVRRLKPIVDLISVCIFVVFPLTLQKVKHPVVQYLLPSRWFIATVVIMILSSRLAHFLDDAGYAIINGVEGNLSDGDISEFRELNMYYGYLVYVYGLVFNKGKPVMVPDENMSYEPK